MNIGTISDRFIVESYFQNELKVQLYEKLFIYIYIVAFEATYFITSINSLNRKHGII